MSDAQPARHKLHWLPNALTVSRIVMIPVLVWQFLAPVDAISPDVMSMGGAIVFLVFAFCMFTDWLDGFLARKWKVVSPFGRMLDPIADKLLVASCLICICILNAGAFIFVLPAFVIIGRDIFVSGIREHAANAGIVLSPTKLAKWKTAFEMLAILLYILSHVVPRAHYEAINTASIALLWLAAILSAYTGFHYFRSAMRKPG